MKLCSRFSLSLAVAGLAASLPAQAVVSFVNGQAALAGKPLPETSSAEVRVLPGQVFATGRGTAALLLTPGAELRLDEASAVKLVAANDGRIEIAIVGGRATIRLDGMRQGGELQVDTAGKVETLLLRNGFYEFDQKAGLLRVFEGKAGVANAAGSGWIDVKAGQQLALGTAAFRPVSFDRDAADSFVRQQDSFRSGAFDRDSVDGGPGSSPLGYQGFGYLAFAYPGYVYPAFGYPGYGFYSPFAFGYAPGFYGSFGYGRGFGYGGFGGGRFHR